jgi:hypothetical protein
MQKTTVRELRHRLRLAYFGKGLAFRDRLIAAWLEWQDRNPRYGEW